MTWTRLPDDFTDRPDVLRLSRSARLLHVEALIWCNRLLTNGELPTNVLRRVTDSDDIDSDVNELAKAGLWTRIDDDTWQVDWSDQEPAAQVEKRKQKRAAIQKKYNERKERHADGDHSICDPRFCRNASRDASDDRSRDQSIDSHPSRPVPTRPVPTGREGQGQGDWADRAASATAPAARPPRASDGQLVALDDATFAALPFWFDNDDCSHKANGWAWTKDDRLACELCYTTACGSRNGSDVIMTRPDWLVNGLLGGAQSPAQWSALFDVDPAGTTLVLDLASVIYRKAGPPTPDPVDVLALAEDIYRRSISADRLIDVINNTKETP